MTSKIHEIAFEIDAKLKSTFSSGFVSATNKIGNLETKIKEFEKASAKKSIFESNLIKSHRKVLELNRSLTQLRTTNNELAREIKSSDTPTKEQARNFEKSCRQARMMKEQLLELRYAESKAKQSLESESKSVTELSKSYKKAAAEVVEFSKVQELQSKLQSKKERLIKLHSKSNQLMASAYNSKAYMDSMISLTMKMAHPIQKALEIETAAAQVQKNIHFESLKEYKEWQDNLFKLSLNNPVSQTDLLHMAEQAGASAIAKDQISGLVQEAAKLSAVMKISGEDATKLLIDWRTGLDLTQDKANSLADALVNLGDKSANSTSWIASFVAQAGQEAKMAGLSAEQTAAFGSAITGMQPEKAATGLIAITNAMTKGTKATKSQAVAFDQLGINVKKLQEDMSVDAVKAINNVVNLIKTKIPKAQQSAISNALVGATGAPIMAQMINNQALIEKQLSIVSNPANYAGRVDKEANIVNSSTLAQIQLLKNNIDSIQLTLADTFLPTIRDIIGVVKEVVDDIKPWIKENEGLLKALVPVGAALAGISIAVTGMTWLFSGTLAIAIKVVTAAIWLFNIALKANPIVLVVTAIGAMSFALYEFFTKTETGQKIIGKLVDGIEWLIDRVQQKIFEKIQSIINMWNKIKEIAGSIRDYFSGSSKTAQISVVHQMGKNNLDESVKKLMDNQKQNKGNQTITYNAPQNITVNGGDAEIVKQATRQTSQQAQTQFDAWYNSRLAY